MSDNNGLPGKPGVREELEYALAMHFSNNRMPHMSGDPRNRLSSLQRRNMEDAVTSILEVIGPCLTPAEVEARVKEARRDALEEAARREMPPEFLDWMKRQMPKDTIIGNPEWWAGRIWRAAIHAMKKGEGDE
jgi:hypothetical protein